MIGKMLRACLVVLLGLMVVFLLSAISVADKRAVCVDGGCHAQHDECPDNNGLCDDPGSACPPSTEPDVDCTCQFVARGCKCCKNS